MVIEVVSLSLLLLIVVLFVVAVVLVGCRRGAVVVACQNRVGVGSCQCYQCRSLSLSLRVGIDNFRNRFSNSTPGS